MSQWYGLLGGEIETTIGGVEAASVATKGALFEATKNDLTFDLNEKSINENAQYQKMMQSAYALDVQETTELNAEIDRMFEKSALPKEQMSAVKAMMARMATTASQGENPAEWLRKHPAEVQRVYETRTIPAENGYNKVTNLKLTPDTKVNVVSVTGADIPSIKTNADKTKLIENLVGVKISLPFTNASGTFKNKTEGRHFVSSSYAQGRNDTTRLKALNLLDKVLPASIYVDKHPDAKGKKNHFVEFFVPIQDGNNIIVFRVSAEEVDTSNNIYEIQDVNFYDFINEKTVRLAPISENPNMDVTAPPTVLSEITIAEMLTDVKDKNGNFYVNPDGSLNYEVTPVKLKNENGYNQSAWHGSSEIEAVRQKYQGTDQWMKAPNGKPTKLTEEQWLQVRTPSFKRWFGDWEFLAEVYPQKVAKERKDVEGIVKELKGKMLKSLPENIEASFSHKGLSKIGSEAATRKSRSNGFTDEEHFTAVANVEGLFAHSFKVNERPDDNRDIHAIEHFSAPFIVNGKTALVTFTIKVTNNAGRKIYSIEVMELKKVEGKVQGEAFKHHQASSTFDALNISQISDKVNNTSKIVDENGEPMVVYHGTKEKFDTFGKGEKGILTEKLRTFYFTNSKEYASVFGSKYGGVDMACFLNIRNPKIVSQEIIEDVGYLADDDTLDDFETRHDGLVMENFEQIVAFNPTQIKSATDNNGNFDPSDPNIYHKATDGQILGSTSWDAEGKAIINLFNGSDVSTVTHEIMHYFLEAVNTDVLTGFASENQVKDLETLLKYAGTTTADFQKMTEEQKRTYHERIAEAFETYLMERKAPSFEIKKIFDKIKNWMLSIYEHRKRNENALPLTDEVAAVFDSMLATEEALREVEVADGYLASLPKAVVDTLDEKSKDKLRGLLLQVHDKAVDILAKRANENFSEERKAQIAKFKADILPVVTQQIQDMPLYQAEELLQDSIGQDVSVQDLAQCIVDGDKDKLAKLLSRGNNKDVAQGKTAIQKVIETHQDVKNAVHRNDIGNIGIVWGVEGKGKKFKGGYGLSHIIAKRNAEGLDGVKFALQLPEILVFGKVIKTQNAGNGTRILLEDNSRTAVVSLYRNNEKENWVVTAWDNSTYKNKKTSSDGTDVVYDTTEPTTDGTTRSRSYGADNVSFDDTLSQDKDNVNSGNVIEIFNYIAEYNGFANGQELAHQILNMPTEQQAINNRVDEYAKMQLSYSQKAYPYITHA